MKQLSNEEVNFLFDWVKNWFPTSATPKIAILLLNKKEWRRLYEELPSISSEKLKQRVYKELEKYPKEIRQLFDKIEQLPKNQKSQLLKIISPHFSEKAQNINYWMKEIFGECFKIEELKYMAELVEQQIPRFFKPFMSYDFVIIISAFFNKEQRKIVKSKRDRQILIHATIFHELIHVIEKCNNTKIFKTDDIRESMKITFHLARKYFEEL